MSDDDDWFERALREDDEGEDGSTADSESGESVERGESDRFEESDQFGESHGRSESGGFGAADEFGESEGFDGSDDASFGDSEDLGPEDDASAGGFADADPYDADEQSPSSSRTQSDDADERDPPGGRERPDDADDLFDEDFASAFENAPGGRGSSAGRAGPAGETSGGDDLTGGFGGGSGDFGGGNEFGGEGGEFGMGADEGFDGGFGDSGESFDDEEFESSIPRIDVGIEGLDDMIQGGVPERSLVTTIGSAGTGKTTFGLQFLHEALRQDENAVFIALEESRERIVDTATEKGWNFDEYVEEGSLAVVDLDPIEMANSLTSIRNDLPRLVEEFGATRLVLDSVSLLEMMYDDQATRRNEVYDFTKSLKQAGVTTMLTSEASEDNAYASRHGIIEYLVDAVFVLRYIRSSDDFRETRLAVEIQKIRDANHSREIKPYSITNEGISVYRQANIF